MEASPQIRDDGGIDQGRNREGSGSGPGRLPLQQPLLGAHSGRAFPKLNPPPIRPHTRASGRLSFRDLASPLPERVKLKWGGSSDWPATNQMNATWFRPNDSLLLNELERRRGAHSTLGFYPESPTESPQQDRPSTPPARASELEIQAQMRDALLRDKLSVSLGGKVVKLPTMSVATKDSPLAGQSRLADSPLPPSSPDRRPPGSLSPLALAGNRSAPSSPDPPSSPAEKRWRSQVEAQVVGERSAEFAREWEEISDLHGEEFRALALLRRDLPSEVKEWGPGRRRASVIGTVQVGAGKAARRVRVPHWPKRNEEAFARGKLRLSSFELDALSFTSDDLCHLALEIFLELDVPAAANVALEPLRRLILAVRARMLDNPYHNWWHAFDVTQTLYTLLIRTGVLQELPVHWRLGVMVAGLCHDLEHPGVNNAFLDKGETKLAQALERHHTFRALSIVDRPDIALLASLPHHQAHEVRVLIKTLILATDMARHADYVATLRRHAEAVERGERPEMSLMQRLEIIIKTADTSNVLKPFMVGKKWLLRVTEEFFQQGDKERRNGMPVTPSYDRNQQLRVELQKGFIDFLMMPYYELVIQLFPQLSDIPTMVRSNRQWWDRYDDTRLLNEARAAGFAPPSQTSFTGRHKQFAPWTSETRFGDMKEATVGVYRKERHRAAQGGDSKWNLVREKFDAVLAMRGPRRTQPLMTLTPDPLLPFSDQLVRKTHNIFKSAMHRHQQAKERFNRHAAAWNF